MTEERTMTEESGEDLRRLNEQLTIEENAGNRLFFETRLAPVFALKRANGCLDSREMFLLSLKPGGERRCDPKSIDVSLVGRARALVSCVVTVDNDSFHNIRLFIKDADGRWVLLSWANERL
jgi:hypothetical protein